MRKLLFAILCSAAALCSVAASANAVVKISDKPTKNMSCDGGVCSATAAKAVLNVNDLANMLASGDAKVVSGSIAQNIDIDAEGNIVGLF